MHETLLKEATSAKIARCVQEAPRGQSSVQRLVIVSVALMVGAVLQVAGHIASTHEQSVLLAIGLYITAICAFRDRPASSTRTLRWRATLAILMASLAIVVYLRKVYIYSTQPVLGVIEVALFVLLWATLKQSYCPMLWMRSFQAAASWGLTPSIN